MQLMQHADAIVITHHAQIRALCGKDLKAMLVKHAPHNASEHKKRMKKSERGCCVESLLPFA